MKLQKITIALVMDTEGTDHPASWDWRSMLDLGPDETFEVLSIEDMPETLTEKVNQEFG